MWLAHDLRAPTMKPGPVLAHLLTATFVAWLAVSGPMVLGVLLLGILTTVVLVSALRLAFRGHVSVAAVTAGLYVLVTGSIVALAATAPGKRIDTLLASPVSLPQAEMTLADLGAWAQSIDSRDALPIRTSVSVDIEARSQTVRWPARVVTLGEFITAVEEQTQLRHRFMGCGTCTSILGGNDCSFGLTLCTPAKPPPFP